jgi:DnaJ-class molecular chaperone
LAAPDLATQALGVLNLTWPVTMDAVKTRYKELAKRHHPDANGGDKASEEILKSVNLAYAALRSKFVSMLAPTPQPAAE